MSQTQNSGRFRANPVEIVIFLVIALIFLQSTYNLLYSRKGFRPTALSPMTSSPITEGRTPSSVSQSLMTLEVPCDTPLEKETLANKIRLRGTLCGQQATSIGGQLVKAKIVNTLNKFTATVFTDNSSSKYSTDYIPLSNGKNRIHLEFSYNNGETISQDVQVTQDFKDSKESKD